MNGGPFSTSRSVDRNTPGQSRSPRRTSESPRTSVNSKAQSAKSSDVSGGEAGRVEYSSNNTENVGDRKKLLFRSVLAVAVVIVLVLGAVFLYSRASSVVGVDKDKYQVVFFENGQFYFGKLSPVNGQYVKLNDVYYMISESGDPATSPNSQDASNPQAGTKLIKLGDEIHGPEDEMIIPKNKILFYENLKSDSRVSSLIKEHKDQ